MTEKKNPPHAAEQNKAGLAFFSAWEIERSIGAFKAATSADPDNPEYHLNLARAYARGGDYAQAMHSLGEYLRSETQDDVAARYERLFSSALDDVEASLTEVMPRLDMPMQQIGKAIQMWLEYRITIGRRPLHVPQPEQWAAALTYAIAKVNLAGPKLARVADAYQVNERSVKEKFDEVVKTLDLMPADYRYFTGEENPLDKLVEAAQRLEELDRQFRED
jgi:tetratricopeptide (TPR) repeat protein